MWTLGKSWDARMEWRIRPADSDPFQISGDVGTARWRRSTATYQQIRAFFYNEAGRAAWEVWSNQEGNDDSAEFTLRDKGIFSIGVIPVVWFMPGEKRTPMTAEPALIDLARSTNATGRQTSSQ